MIKYIVGTICAMLLIGNIVLLKAYSDSEKRAAECEMSIEQYKAEIKTMNNLYIAVSDALADKERVAEELQTKLDSNKRKLREITKNDKEANTWGSVSVPSSISNMLQSE